MIPGSGRAETREIVAATMSEVVRLARLSLMLPFIGGIAELPMHGQVHDRRGFQTAEGQRATRFRVRKGAIDGRTDGRTDG